ncbi:MAG: type II toxin-antitoxin system RelE/ParE family toxin, partial [Pseudanabaena sp.]
AFRCVYIAKFLDTVVVLHSFEKTTNGVDRQAMKTIEKRYKELKAEIEKMKRQK